MSRAKAVVEKLEFPRELSSELLPLNPTGELRQILLESIEKALNRILGRFESVIGKISSCKCVYLKPNGIDTKPYCYTRPVFIEAVIKYLKNAGAKNIVLMENSTQCNFTRLVFAAVGYSKICKKYKVKQIFLDEDKTIKLEFKGKPKADGDPSGYIKKMFEMPKTIAEIMNSPNDYMYINLPKLKTHSMTGVTLGIKNQWAFPSHSDRRFDHNYNLHYKLVDLLEYIRPDFTLIEGIDGTIHGHYPATSLAKELVKPFRVIIGSDNVVAADLAGARVFGLTPDDVPHIKIAMERNLAGGISSPGDVEIIGDLSAFDKKYPYDIVQKFPPGVNFVTGKELWCREGCRNNPLTLMQILHLDFGADAEFDFVAGKGFDPEEIDSLRGPVFIAGHCAWEEVGERLVKRLGRKKVFYSNGCNNLADSAAALFYLMKVSPLKMVPLNPLKAVKLLIQTKLKGSKARVPSLFSNIFKKV